MRYLGLTLAILFFFSIHPTYGDGPAWKKDFDKEIREVMISGNGELIAVKAKYSIYLLDKEGNEIFSENSTIEPPTIGFYNNSWFYCKFPNNYFFDTDNNVHRKYLTETPRKCIHYVISDEASNKNLYISADAAYDDAGGKLIERYYEDQVPYSYTIREIPINPLGYINGMILSVYLEENGIHFERIKKWDYVPGSMGFMVNSVERWDYGLAGDALSVDMSKDGKLIAASSEGGDIYVFNNSGELLWEYRAGGGVYKILISKDTEENIIAALSSDGNFFKFDENGTLLSKRAVQKKIDAISIDGHYLVITSDSKGEPLKAIEYYSSEIKTINESNVTVQPLVTPDTTEESSVETLPPETQTVAPPVETMPPKTPAMKVEEKKGICGPTLIIAFALIPFFAIWRLRN